MQTHTRFPIALLLVLALAGGCGRGGSSGLDIGTENAAISRALDDQQCVDYQNLQICPADESAVTPGATPNGPPRVETSLANATSIDCHQANPGGACTFVLTFVPQSFPAGETFNVLSRSGASSNPWVLGSDPVAGSGGSFTSTLVLTAPQGGAPDEVQLAVLAFAGSSTAPGEVDQLHDTAADYAFVTAVLAVHVVSPTVTPSHTAKATRTPTPTNTPGANDCCQCESSCAAPINGDCGTCTVVVGAACFGEELCVQRTATPTRPPTATPTGCLVDNGDGTINDDCSGLMWEKKDQAGGLHDHSARYPWAGVCNHDLHVRCQPDSVAATICADATNDDEGCTVCAEGMKCIDLESHDLEQPLITVWGWLAQLNQAPGFAGHTDWRIPSVAKDGHDAELETIVLPSCDGGSACVPAQFDANCPIDLCNDVQGCASGLICPTPVPLGADPACQSDPACTVTSCSCTRSEAYWSSTRFDVDNVWTVDFSNGSLQIVSREQIPKAARAVRGMANPPPTQTPAADDCCQCEASCAAPIDGSCGGCPIVAGASCDGSVCAANTPTPTAMPCVLSDNGDGTITDSCTQLSWEKKDEAGGLHDTRTLYTWAGACMGNSSLCQPNAAAAAACAAQTGGAVGCAECAGGTCIADPSHNGAVTTIWDWLSQLNAAGFAGFSDWRIPTVGFEGDIAELETILGPTEPPCAPVLPEFDSNCTAGCSLASCSCTAASYWSATTYLAEPGNAEEQDFVNCGGHPGVGPKTNAYSVRAVRSEEE